MVYCSAASKYHILIRYIQKYCSKDGQALHYKALHVIYTVQSAGIHGVMEKAV